MWILLILAAFKTDCYQITDMDQRNYCISRERQDAGQCQSIMSSSLRASCRAEIEKSPSVCDQLMGDARQLCKSRATN